ncbi:hypothetical protein Leryth_006256 [Lithospermum erythrorhizon]|nr:hypothetical protein Leryth_006256 [Lithospermum erythrorhizon]
MDKDNSLNQGGGFPPSSDTISMFASSDSSFPVKAEPSGSTSFPPLGPVASGGMDSSQFSHDISQMPDNPPRNLGHRRAQSDFFLPDDLGFDIDLGIVGGLDGPSFYDDAEDDFLSMYHDINKFNSSATTSSCQMSEPSSSKQGASGLFPGQSVTPNTKPRIRHQHSQSMDGSTLLKSDVLTSSGEDPSTSESKKSISAAKLAELAVIDPKRAKRIWANRQSAARSKERKMRYIAELERKLQTLQTEASMLSAQLGILQRDTTGLTTENSELKLRLQSVEQQVNLQDALNDALKDEIHHLKVMTGQISNGGSVLNFNPSFSGTPQFYPNNHANARHSMLAAQQFQQLQIYSRRPQQQHPFHQMQQQQQAQPMMQQRDQFLQQSGDMNLRGTVPPSHSQNDNASDMGSKDPK